MKLQSNALLNFVECFLIVVSPKNMSPPTKKCDFTLELSTLEKQCNKLTWKMNAMRKAAIQLLTLKIMLWGKHAIV